MTLSDAGTLKLKSTSQMKFSNALSPSRQQWKKLSVHPLENHAIAYHYESRENRTLCNSHQWQKWISTLQMLNRWFPSQSPADEVPPDSNNFRRANQQCSLDMSNVTDDNMEQFCEKTEFPTAWTEDGTDESSLRMPWTQSCELLPETRKWHSRIQSIPRSNNDKWRQLILVFSQNEASRILTRGKKRFQSQRLKSWRGDATQFASQLKNEWFDYFIDDPLRIEDPMDRIGSNSGLTESSSAQMSNTNLISPDCETISTENSPDRIGAELDYHRLVAEIFPTFVWAVSIVSEDRLVFVQFQMVNVYVNLCRELWREYLARQNDCREDNRPVKPKCSSCSPNLG
jgi:hypothetical protein